MPVTQQRPALPACDAALRLSCGSAAHEVIEADSDDQKHQPDKQVFYGTVVHSAVAAPAHDSPANAARDHERQRHPGKFRHGLCDQSREQAGQLAEEDDIQAVGCGCLCVHTEKIIQDDQIDGAAADAQKAGQDTQQKPDPGAERFALDIAGPDVAFAQRVSQRSQRDKRKAACLYGADRVLVRKKTPEYRKQLLSEETAERCTDG